MKKTLLFILTVVALTYSTQAQTYQLTEKAIIATSMERIHTGYNNFRVDASGTLHALYMETGSAVDNVYLTSSTDNGFTWSTPEVISFYSHISSAPYRIGYVNGTQDDNGKWHIVYNYRGAPLYNASSGYPPEHAAYVTNESGSWETYMDVMNDSLALATSGETPTTSYIYNTTVFSQNNTEYLSAYDYAWFAEHSHVIHAKRLSGGTFHAPGEAIVTYDRGMIDQHPIGVGQIFGDGTDVHVAWFNRHMGEMNIKTLSGPSWGPTTNLFTVTDPIDGVLSTYGFSPSKGNAGNVKALFTRWEDNGTNNSTIYSLKKTGNTWDIDDFQYSGKVYYPQTILKSDSLVGMFLPAGSNELKLFIETATGFSSVMNVLPPSTDDIVIYNTLQERDDLILYVRANTTTGEYTLAVGELTEYVGINETNDPYTQTCDMLRLYPNPTSGNGSISFTVNETSTVEFNLIDCYGKQISSSKSATYITGNHTLELKEILKTKEANPGVYTVQMIVDGSISCNKRLIIK